MATIKKGKSKYSKTSAVSSSSKKKLELVNNSKSRSKKPKSTKKVSTTAGRSKKNVSKKSGVNAKSRQVKKPVEKIVKKNILSKKSKIKTNDFDLTLPEPPKPPEKNKSHLFSKSKKTDANVNFDHNNYLNLDSSSIKKVKLDENDFVFPHNFKQETLFILKSKKSNSDKSKKLFSEYGKQFNNHLKSVKFEIGKSHKDISENSNLSAQEIIDVVKVEGSVKPLKHVKVDIDKIIKLNKPHDKKVDLIHSAFQDNIRDHIESLEFNIEYDITKNQPYFDELEKLDKKIPLSDIPRPEDFADLLDTSNELEKDDLVPKPKNKVVDENNEKGKHSLPNVGQEIFDKISSVIPISKNKDVNNSKNLDNKNLPVNIKSKETSTKKKEFSLFKKFLKSSDDVIEESNNVSNAENNLKQKSKNPINTDNAFDVNQVDEGEDLDTFMKNEEKRLESYKLVIPAQKVKANVERRKSLGEHENDLVQRETRLMHDKELHDREREDLEKEKIKHNDGILELQKTLNVQLEELENKRLELEEKEKVLNKKSDELKRKDIDVKRILEKEVEINDLKITLDTKDSELKKKESSINRREKTVEERIRRYETLKAEIDRHRKLETFEKQISLKESKLSEKQATLNEKESYLKARDDELKIKEKSLKELQKDLDLKLKNYKKDKTSELEKKEKSLKTLENEITDKQKELDNYKNDLENSRVNIKKEAQKVEDEEFNLLMSEEKIKQKYGTADVPSSISFDDMEKLDEVMAMPELEQAEVYRLVTRCRELLRKKNYDNAKNVYNEIKERYAKLDIDSEEKQIIYNTIRELYDDIRLAMIY